MPPTLCDQLMAVKKLKSQQLAAHTALVQQRQAELDAVYAKYQPPIEALERDMSLTDQQEHTIAAEIEADKAHI